MAKKKAKKTADAKANKSFEESLAELEEVVAALEGGELGLDEALAEYERGVAGLKRCHEQLQHAERRIELLSGVDADGNPISEPFDEEDASTAESAPGARAKRRSRDTAKRERAAGVDDGPGLF